MPRFGKKSKKSKLTLPNLRLSLKNKNKSNRKSNNSINNIIGGTKTVSNNNSRVKVNELLNQYINELSDTTTYRPSIHNQQKYTLLASNFNNRGNLRRIREGINYNNLSKDKVKEFLKLYKQERIYNVRSKSSSENLGEREIIYPENMNTNTQPFSTFGSHKKRSNSNSGNYVIRNRSRSSNNTKPPERPIPPPRIYSELPLKNPRRMSGETLSTFAGGAKKTRKRRRRKRKTKRN